MSGEKYYKLRLSVGPDAVSDLTELAIRKNISTTEVIRRALADYKFFQNQLLKGRKIILYDEKTNKEWLLTEIE